MKKDILPLTLGGLSLGTTEFVIMGILPNVAQYFDISISSAGQFISLYALGVVVGAPLIVFVSGRLAPKTILIILMLMFTLFNGLSIISNSVEMLSISRFLSGLPHGAFFGVGSIVARRLALPGKEAKNISLMFLGLTIANVIMVPLGTYFGQAFSWQLTMGLVTFIGLSTLISVVYWLPDLPIKNKVSFKEELSFFKTKEAWLITLMTALGTGGGFAWLSYIAPTMTDVAGFAEEHMSYIMILVGVGMVVGNLLGGLLADKISPIKSCILLFGITAVHLILFSILAYIPGIALLLCFIIGASFLALASPVQLLMMRTAGKSEMIGSGVTQASFNTGNSLGAYLGGLVLFLGFGFTYPALVGAALAFIGFLLALILFRVGNLESSQSSKKN